MKRFIFFAILGLIISCETVSENQMTVSGTIKGLKKGTLYLQHIPDSTLMIVDSVAINGDGSYSLSHEVESPEIYYLYLKKNDNNEYNDRIQFFGESGEITINSSWNQFEYDASISGSKSQKKLEECLAMLSKFNKKELEIYQTSQSNTIKNDSIALDSMHQLIDKNSLRRYLYALNFSLNNKDSYVAPYVLLTQANITTKKYLDSIYNNLSPKVANSKYGKELKDYIANIEDEE